MDIQGTISQFSDFAKQNPVVSSIIGLYGAGVLTFLLRNVPSHIISLVKRYMTTTVSIANVHEGFYNLMEIFDTDGLVNRLRVVKFTNGKWGTIKIQKGIGDGLHLFWFRRHLIMAHLEIQQSTELAEKMTLTLTKWGRSHKLFDQIKDELLQKEGNFEPGKTNLCKYEDGWTGIQSAPARKMDSIILTDSKKEKILGTIQNFLDKEDWYIDHGVPYQLGILLHGKPGTGKTSIIKAIADHFGYKVCIFPADSLYRLQNAICYLPSKGLLVIEDIDSYSATHQREKSGPEHASAESGNGKNRAVAKRRQHTKEKEESFLAEYLQGGLSSVLNSIDGLLSLHGRILIMTTNHPEKLDGALLRPGRVDLSIEIGYVGVEEFKMFCRKFYNLGAHEISIMECQNYEIKPETTVAMLQNDYLMGRKFSWMMENYCVRAERDRKCLELLSPTAMRM